MQINIPDVNVHVYVHLFDTTALADIQTALSKLTSMIGLKMAALDDDITALQTEVTNNTTVSGSVVTLINGFAATLSAAVTAAQAAGATPTQLAAINAAIASMTANDSAMAAAVAANATPPTP